MSRRASAGESFGPPANLGSTVNSASDEFDPWLSADGRTLFFASDRAGGNGSFDLYRAPIRVVPTSQTIKPADGWVDVLSLVNVVGDSMRDGGTWTREGDALRSPTQQFARIAVPVQPKGTYHLRAEFTRVAGSGAISLYLPVGEGQVLFVADGWNSKGLSGLQSVRGNNEPNPANAEGFAMPPLKNGQRYALNIEVQKTGTGPGGKLPAVRINAGLADGTNDARQAIKMRWFGLTDSLSLVNPKFSLGDAGRLGLAAWDSQVQFHSLELKMDTGEAKLLRPPVANSPP